MSEHQPPSGAPEYLEYGSGEPIPSEPAPVDGGTPARKSRRAWWIGAGVVALLGVGAGAWAALGFFQQGAQPAEALPSTTVGYLSVDLDPAGGQKIDAFRTLNKFPAFKDEVGVNSVDELRHKLGDSFVGGFDCKGLDYNRDIDPWLGDRMAVAAVMIADEPQVVGVVQVKDEDAARNGIAQLNACDDSDKDAGYSVHDGWAVLAESQKVVDQVVDATADATLADDASYQKWTDAVGDAGVVNAYASPDAGRVLADQVGGLFQGALTGVPGSASFVTPDTTVTQSATASGSGGGAVAAGGDNPLSAALKGFKGGAATVRFTGDGLELAVAGDARTSEASALTGTTGGRLVSRLPADTATALGISLKPGWLDQRLDAVADGFGGMAGLSSDDLRRGLRKATGLETSDIEDLLGSGVTISVGKDIDFEAAENSSDGTGLPIAAMVQGDPDAVANVLDRIRVRAGDLPLLGSDASDDLIAIGPTEEYRKQVLAGGDLGSDDTFVGVVPDATNASTVLYVDLDRLEPAISRAAAGDKEALDNLTPLRAFGISAWDDDGVARFSLKVSTD
jgi:hypothetical protein